MKFFRKGYPWVLVALLIATGIVVLRQPGDQRASKNAADPAREAIDPVAGGQGSFRDWMGLVKNGGQTEKSIQQGIGLARQRRLELSALMKRDPAAALGRLLSYAELAALPEAVRAECERPWSGTGSIDLRWETHSGEEDHRHCQHQNIAFVGAESWRIYGADFVEPHAPRTNVPMQGYVIGKDLLLESSALHPVTGGDLAAAKGLFPVGNESMIDPLTGNKANPEVAAVAGGKVFFFESPGSFETIDLRLIAASQQAEQNKVAKLDHDLAFLTAGNQLIPYGGNPVQETPYLNNAVNVLFIRVDFSDFPGEPVTKPALESTLASVSSSINKFSYGQASITYTVTPSFYRMPATGASYALSGNNDGLMTAAKTLATNAGYTLSNYNVIAVYFPDLGGIEDSQITYAGLASVGGGNHWINGANDETVMVHEFGHNYGLYHANFWDPEHDFLGFADYLDPSGNSFEYGDMFDTMGQGLAPDAYFSPFATRRLEWMPATKVVEPAASGTWRISRFDDPAALANTTLALRVPMGGSRYYWVGLRKRFGSPSNLLNAAYVVGEGLYVDRPNLIDMTPNSSGSATSDRRDAGLPVGASLYDSSAGVKFETLASGGTAPNEWIDVKITFDPRISIVDTTPEVDEKSGTALITVRRTFGTTGVATVNYATVNGTATAGSDFYATSGTLTWASGDTTDKTVRVAIRPDALNEGRENFTFQLSGVTGAALNGQASAATVTLVDAGKQLTKFNPGFFNSTVKAIVPLADGKVLIGGTINSSSGEFQAIHHIARLTADGAVDTTFTTGTGFNAEVLEMAVQPDGKILVGGAFTSYNDVPCNRLVRLNANGTLDTAFVTALGTGPNGSEITALAVEASGSILVGGNFDSFAGATTEGMVRLTSVGARDTVNPLNLPFTTAGFSSVVRDILCQDDGKIMVAGSFYIGWTGTGFRPAVARLNANGTRDTSFDPDAGPHGGTTSTLGYLTTLARQPDGKYLIGGSFSNYDEHPAANLARIQANGAFDATFTGPAFDSILQDIVVQGSGGIVVGGWFNSPVKAFKRLTATGAVDASFLSGTGPDGAIYAVVEGIDGALWAGGNFFGYDGVTSRPVIKVAGGDSPYAFWAKSKFTSAQVASGVTDSEDDPDGDGVRNGGEFALGTNPTKANASPLFPTGAISVVANASDHYLQVSLERSAQVGGVWCVAQFSNDLVNWTPAAPVPGGNATYDVLEDSGARFTVRDKTAASGAPKRFGRIVFKQPQ